MSFNEVNGQSQAQGYYIGEELPSDVIDAEFSEKIKQIASVNEPKVQGGSSDNVPLLLRCLRGKDSVQNLNQKADVKARKVSRGILSSSRSGNGLFPVDSCDLKKNRSLWDKSEENSDQEINIGSYEIPEEPKQEPKKASGLSSIFSFLGWLFSDIRLP